MLWEHETQVSVSTAFSSSLNLHECFYLTIRLWAQDFYRVILDEGAAQVNYRSLV